MSEAAVNNDPPFVEVCYSPAIHHEGTLNHADTARNDELITVCIKQVRDILGKGRRALRAMTCLKGAVLPI